MLILAAMILVYGVCCFGSMKKIAYLYFVMAVINAAFYFAVYQLDTTEDSPWLFLIYGYGVTESYLKMLFLLGIWRWTPILWRNEYLWLIVLLFMHIINDAFNSFHYGVFNSTLILCELTFFVRRSKGVRVGIANKVCFRNIRGFRADRSGL